MSDDAENNEDNDGDDDDDADDDGDDKDNDNECRHRLQVRLNKAANCPTRCRPHPTNLFACRWPGCYFPQSAGWPEVTNLVTLPEDLQFATLEFH